MKRLFAAAAFCLVPASAFAQTFPFHGGGVTTTMTPACINDGWKLGAPIKIRWWPSGVGQNGPQTFINVFHDTYAFSHTMSGPLTVAFKSYQGHYIGNGSQSYPGTIRRVSQTPATITAATTSIDVTMIITNQGGTMGCTATLTAKLYRR